MVLDRGGRTSDRPGPPGLASGRCRLSTPAWSSFISRTCPVRTALHPCRRLRAAVEEGEAIAAAATPVLDEVRGMAMLSQTCDVIRSCRARPFVEVAALVEVPEPWVEEIRRLKRPAFALCTSHSRDQRLVADLDRSMTVEKALVAGWTRIPGWEDRRGAARFCPVPRPQAITLRLSRRFRCRGQPPPGAYGRETQQADRRGRPSPGAARDPSARRAILGCRPRSS